MSVPRRISSSAGTVGVNSASQFKSYHRIFHLWADFKKKRPRDTGGFTRSALRLIRSAAAILVNHFR